MRERSLGSQGLKVSEIGYGCMGISMGYGPSVEAEGVNAIRHAHDLGVTFFDTAELYGWGENEKVVGRALRGIRDEVTIASKFGFTPEWGFDSRPQNIRKVIDNSLVNLGVEYVDLYYQHRVDPAVPIEEVVGTVGEFVDAGKVKYIGLCEAGDETLRRAHATHPISVLQTEYSLFAREVESVLPVVRDLGIGFVPYSPLARGFLSGAVTPADRYDETDARGSGQLFPWWYPENFDHNLKIVELLTALAASKGAALSQLALAWLLHQGDDIVPIPGSRDPGRVALNVAATEVLLTAADLQAIDVALGDGPRGKRNNEGVVWS